MEANTLSGRAGDNDLHSRFVCADSGHLILLGRSIYTYWCHQSAI